MEKKNPSLLFSLPEEMIEKVTSYLDFKDLKTLSQTCKYLNEISWLSLSKISVISISRTLTHNELETFAKSERTYQNVRFSLHLGVKFWSCGDIELLLRQLSVPSIKLRSVFLTKLSDSLEYRILKKYEHEIQTITMTVRGSMKTMRRKADEVKSLFPSKSVISKPIYERCFTKAIDFNEMNSDLNFPTEMEFRSLMNLKFGTDIHNVEKLSFVDWSDKNPYSLTYFKNLKDLKIWSQDLKTVEAVIENNKDTLCKLDLAISAEPWKLRLPCQLKDLKFSGDSLEVLENQKYLRSIALESFTITNEVLDVLAENKLLTYIKLEGCNLENSIDLTKFEFLRNVQEIYFSDYGLQERVLFEAIFENSVKVTRFVIDAGITSEETTAIKPKILTDLKHLEVISGGMFVKFVSESIRAPNLECLYIPYPNPTISCILYPNTESGIFRKYCQDFVLECRKLRTLTIKGILTHSEIIDILESLPCLETFNFEMNGSDFEKSLIYISKTIAGIKNVGFELNGKHSHDIYGLMESNSKYLECNFIRLSFWNKNLD